MKKKIIIRIIASVLYVASIVSICVAVSVLWQINFGAHLCAIELVGLAAWLSYYFIQNIMAWITIYRFDKRFKKNTPR